MIIKSQAISDDSLALPFITSQPDAPPVPGP